MIPGVKRTQVALAVVLVGVLDLATARVRAAERPVEQILAGDEAYARADLPSARAAYLSALRFGPHQFETLCRLARVESDLSRVEKGEEQRRLVSSAVERAGAAVKLAPDSALGHLVLAEALARQSDHEGPRTRLALSRQIKGEVDRSLALDPHQARAYHVRGVWNLEMATRGWYDRAMGRTVLGGQPRGASLANASQDLEKAVELEPRDIGHRVELARVYEHLKRDSDARRELDTALSLPTGGTPLDAMWQAQARELRGKVR